MQRLQWFQQERIRAGFNRQIPGLQHRHRDNEHVTALFPEEAAQIQPRPARDEKLDNYKRRRLLAE
ncbi:MAG TPA: hypothetical protein VGA61_20800 [Anaerolineae bacterium]